MFGPLDYLRGRLGHLTRHAPVGFAGQGVDGPLGDVDLVDAVAGASKPPKQKVQGAEEDAVGLIRE